MAADAEDKPSGPQAGQPDQGGASPAVTPAEPDVGQLSLKEIIARQQAALQRARSLKEQARQEQSEKEPPRAEAPAETEPLDRTEALADAEAAEVPEKDPEDADGQAGPEAQSATEDQAGEKAADQTEPLADAAAEPEAPPQKQASQEESQAVEVEDVGQAEAPAPEEEVASAAPESTPQADPEEAQEPGMEAGTEPAPEPWVDETAGVAAESELAQEPEAALHAYVGTGTEAVTTSTTHGVRVRRVPLVGIVLAFNTLLVVLVVTLMFSTRPRDGGSGFSSVEHAQGSLVDPAKEGASELPAEPTDGPPSWAKAEQAYQDGRYDLALRQYEGCLALSARIPAERIVSDHFRLRMAMCQAQLGRTDRARQLLKAIADSPSPALRALSCYQLAVLDYRDGQCLLARMQAYQSLATFGLLSQRSAVEVDCEYLLALALTREVLTDRNLDLGEILDPVQQADPFGGLDEAALRQLLWDGTERLSQMPFGVRIQPVDSSALGPRYGVSCSMAALEDVLQPLATESKLDICWVSVPSGSRRRTVWGYFPGASEHWACEVTCGSVGLIARFTGEQVLIYDPKAIESLQERRQLLVAEAEAAWRRFFLRSKDDGRIPRGRFALACLYEASDRPLEALGEHQLVAHRFREDPVAPKSLLRSAGVRADLRDYTGARRDLTELLDRYPRVQECDGAYLDLGRALVASGMSEEALDAFSKLYHLNLSLSSQQAAALEAGKCAHQKGQFDVASTWLARYIKLVKTPTEELAEAYLLLGQCQAHQGKLDPAAQALQAALSAVAHNGQKTRILLEYAALQARREAFASAVAALEQIEGMDPKGKALCDYLLTASRTYRSMALPEMALSLLRQKAHQVADPSGRIRLDIEFARCCAGTGDTEGARKKLSAVLPECKPGPLMYEAACELAEVFLSSGDPKQAVMVMREILKTACPPDVRKRAHEIMGAAYMAMKDYEQAAMAYSATAAQSQVKEDK